MRAAAWLMCGMAVLGGGCGAEAAPDASVDAPIDAAADAGHDAAVPAVARPWIRDDEGGVLVLRGTNVEGASKWTPGFLPPSYVTEADFARLRIDLGMNAVRFLVFWEAVEPAPGAYDVAYLEEVRARIEAAGAAGLHVIVDMHQDVFGAGFGHDGAPRWACDEALYESFTPPDEWYLGYFEPEVHACFDQLWLDPSTRATYGAMWAQVADALRGAEGLLAYELMNEPHWGTTSVRTFEREVAPRAYAEWTDAIRAMDPAPYVMMGPASTANVGLSSNLAPPARERLLYGPHLYPPGLELGTGWTGTDETVRGLTTTILGDAARMGLPVVVGETGGRDDVEGVHVYLTQVYDAFDRDRLSATQWEGGHAGPGSYTLFTLDGAPSAIAHTVARPHPARTAGEPLAWRWDGDARCFEFEWYEDGSARGDTRVTLPSLTFPDGVTATLADAGEATVEGATLVIPQRGGRRTLTVVAR